MSNLSEIKLGEALTFQRGFDITKAEQTHGLVPIVSSSGISSYHSKAKAKAPGVVIGRKGTLGTVHFLNQDYWPHDTTLWVKDFKDNNPQFIAYFLRTLKLENFDTGSSNPTLNRNHIHKVKVIFPKDRWVQRKIAAILTTYDDLIEVNKRRIALLENMAEEIYREWFVRLRFPGHQNTRFVKGVPERWKVVELRDICEEASKSTRAGKHLSDRLYLPLDSLATKQMLPIDHYDYTAAQSSLALFEKGDILFGAMRPYQHKIVIAPFSGVTRTTMFVIRPKEDYLLAYSYLNLFQSSSIEYATLICNGADRPYVVWNRGMERMKVFLPPKETLIKFEEIAGPILKSIREFYFIQRKLAETRDLLLPRLISGKLSVEDLDVQFPPSMQDQPPTLVNDEDCHA